MEQIHLFHDASDGRELWQDGFSCILKLKRILCGQIVQQGSTMPGSAAQGVWAGSCFIHAHDKEVLRTSPCCVKKKLDFIKYKVPNHIYQPLGTPLKWVFMYRIGFFLVC